jgi:hypothetical protein
MNPKIIQFLHPGVQPHLTKNNATFFTKNTGILNWNQGSHKRKYLHTRGDIIGPNNMYQENQDIVFWGEWEPPSQFQLLNNPLPLPQSIHTPIEPGEGGGANTDPFVFGNRFLYSNCMQKVTNKLGNLPDGSIILFGSEYNKSFLLDTVLVIRNSISMALINKEYIKENTDTIFMNTVYNQIGNKKAFKLYLGETYKDNQEIFSFFPCQKYSENNEFQRPILDWQYYNLKEPGAGQGWKEIEYSNEYYNTLKNDLIARGYLLGTKAILPFMMTQITQETKIKQSCSK